MALFDPSLKGKWIKLDKISSVVQISKILRMQTAANTLRIVMKAGAAKDYRGSRRDQVIQALKKEGIQEVPL